jgi:hypothetical protein
MVTRKGDKWEAKCTQCDWTGQAETKEAASKLLRQHLNVHITPKPETKRRKSDKISSSPNTWPDIKKPGVVPFSK